MSEPRTTLRRRRHRLLRAFLVCLFALVALAAAGWFFIVPELAAQRIDALLRQYEPAHREFDVASIGLSRLTLANLQLGSDPWLRAGRIDVRYRLGDLLRGKVIDIDVRDFEWRVVADKQGIDWGFTLPPRTSDTPAAMPFDALSLRDGRLVLDAGGRSIVVPLNATAAAASAALHGEVHTQAITLAGKEVDGLAATWAFDGSRLTAHVDWQLIAQVPLKAVLNLDFSSDRAAGTIDIAQPEFELDDASFIAALWPAFGEFESAGRASIDARFSLAGGTVSPLITLRAREISMADDQWPLAIASASCNVVFDSLSPLSTSGVQYIRITSATSGELDITTADLDYEFDDAGLLRIHAARWFMSDGGRYEASPATIDLNNPRIVTTIACENVDLDFWLRLMTSDRADGQGRLQGEFAIDWNPRARPRIAFTSGSLHAVPSSGYMRIHDAPALSDLLDQADPRFTIDETMRVVKERIIAALQDLGYTSLQLRFVPEGRDTILRTELKGKGRRGERPQEFSGLVMNIGHFGQSLQNVLNTVAAQDRVPELLRRPHRPPVLPVGAPQDGSP